VHIVVKWDDAGAFTQYALGFTEGTVGAPSFDRNPPLICPYAENNNQYLTSLVAVDTGNFNANGTLTGTEFERDPAADNWPRSGWIRYQATFVSLNWTAPPLTNAELAALPVRADGIIELGRYITKTRRTIPKERRVPGYTFITYDSSQTGVPEVPFFAIYEEEIVYTLKEVPFNMYPSKAIADNLILINHDVFDGAAAGTMLFKGVVGEMQPYVGPNGALYFDIPYLFGYRKDTWNKLPVGFDAAGGPAFKTVRQQGAAPNTKRPYKTSTAFGNLFKPRAV
jgi:hypothetical protein